MKVEKLIPLKPKKGTIKNTTAKKEEVEAVTVNRVDNQSEIAEVKSGPEVNVDLDSFFNQIDGESKIEMTDEDINSLGEDNSGNVDSEKHSEKNEVEVFSEETLVEFVEEKKSEGFSQEDVVTDSIKISFKPSRRKTQKRIFIDIEGNATIKNAELLYSNVKAVFDHFDHVEINMTNIKEVDLSVIQLFHVIRVNYYSQNKFIYLNADFAREDRKLLNVCGFTEFQTQKTVQS